MVLWIFGYGSLIWTPDFQYEERVTGYIKDFKRVFAPAKCVEHRRTGNGGRAGLMLTLKPQEGAITGGVAYRVTADVEHKILSSYLEENLSSPSTSRVLTLEFSTGQETPDMPAKIRAMTYITPPETSSLWHVVLQLNTTATSNGHSERASTGLDRAQKTISRKNDQRFSARRFSMRDHWERDRAWFESERTGATT